MHDSVDRGVIPWTQEDLASRRKPATLAMLRPVSAPPPRQEPPVEDQRATEPVKDTEYHSGEAVVPEDGEARQNQAVVAKRLEFAGMETETDESAAGVSLRAEHMARIFYRSRFIWSFMARQSFGEMHSTDSRPRTLLEKVQEFEKASSVPEDVLGNPELEKLYHVKLAKRAIEHVAAQQMQNICRKQRAHRQFVEQIYATVVIKAAVRRRLARLCVRRIRAIIRIQQMKRLVKAVSSSKQLLRRSKLASMALQTVGRGMLARLLFRRLVNVRRQVLHARVLQAATRGFLARSLLQRSRRAAASIQAASRRRTSCIALHRLMISAIAISAAARGVGQRVLNGRRQCAAIHLQATMLSLIHI